MKTYQYAFAILACTACADFEQPESDDSITGAVQIGGGPGGGTDEIPTQGRYLFGESIDDVLPGPPGELFSVQLKAQQVVGATVAQVDISYLGKGAVTLDGSTVFTGTLIMKPTAVSTGELRAIYADGGNDWATYALSWRDTPTSQWETLCDGDVAIPIFQSFSRDGTHLRPQGGPTDRLSWSCANGVAMKCWWWGYWGGGDPDDGRESPWQLHAACTRMARADRCATGTPHTREGTEIQIFDRANVRAMPPDTFQGLNSWPPPVERWSFESAWVSSDRVEDEHAAKCLSHLRWAALPSDGGCEEPLPDPRTDTSADACDDIFLGFGRLDTVENLDDLDTWMETEHVSLLQVSHWNDLPLIPWKSGTDRVMTIDGYIDIDSIKRPYSVNYDPEPATFTEPVLDGTLIRKQTESMLGYTEPVFLYTRGSDHVILSQPMATALLPAAPNNFTLITPAKGYIFVGPDHPDFNLVEVHLYKRGPLIIDYTTATPEHAPNGYSDLGIVGYTPTIEPSE